MDAVIGATRTVHIGDTYAMFMYGEVSATYTYPDQLLLSYKSIQYDVSNSSTDPPAAIEHAMATNILIPQNKNDVEVICRAIREYRHLF